MKVFAIDPSSSVTGIAFFDNDKLLWSKIVSAKGTCILDRMLKILPEVKHYIKLSKPNKIAIETPYMGLSKSTSMKMGEIFGMFESMCVFDCKINSVDILAIHPMTAKKAVFTGSFINRKEGKLKTLQVVRELYPTLEIIDDNAADAIAIGLAAINILKTEK